VSEGEQDGPWTFTQTQPEAFFAAADQMPQEDAKAKAKSSVRGSHSPRA